MTTEFLTVPPTWTVEETLELIQRVGGAKETVYSCTLSTRRTIDSGTWSRFESWS